MCVCVYQVAWASPFPLSYVGTLSSHGELLTVEISAPVDLDWFRVKDMKSECILQI